MAAGHFFARPSIVNLYALTFALAALSGPISSAAATPRTPSVHANQISESSRAPQLYLQVNGFSSNYSSQTEPYRPTISLTGSGFTSVVEIVWSCTMPSGSTCSGSPYTWTSSNWSGKYVVYSDSSAAVSPTLLASGDPTGTYQWSVTFYASDGSYVTKNFSVSYGSTLQVSGFSSSYSSSSEPYQPSIGLTGSGFNSVTEIDWSCTTPGGSSCSGSPYVWTPSNWSGKFVISSDGSATVKPVLLASGDPAGTYQWSVTFHAGSQSVTKSFTVTYQTNFFPAQWDPKLGIHVT